MKATQKKFFLAALKKSQDTFYEEVRAIAEKIRREVIIPVCKQHNLEFVSGNGTYFFTTNNGKTVSDGHVRHDDTTKYDRALKPVFELLGEEVIYNQQIGDYVLDVRKKDY